MHPKSFAATTCNHTCLPVATPRHFSNFRLLPQNQPAVPQNQPATMGPMGPGHVVLLVAAPCGQGWQTQAPGCCWHLWALGHAPGCALPCRFDMLTLFGQHLGVCLWQSGLWRLFAIFGQLVCCHRMPMAPGAGCPQKCVAWAARKPKVGTKAQQAALWHG